MTYRISPSEVDDSKREPTERNGTKGVFSLCLLKWTKGGAGTAPFLLTARNYMDIHVLTALAWAKQPPPPGRAGQGVAQSGEVLPLQLKSGTILTELHRN